MKPVDQTEIRQYVRDNCPAAHVQVAGPGDGSPEVAWGDTFFMYEPAGQFPFATIVTKDYPDDEVSGLNRGGLYRLNIGLDREAFTAMFPQGAALPAPDAIDAVFPHPVYGRMHWVSVINPSPATFESLKPLIAAGYERLVRQAEKKA